jgi:hypothetical protein
MPKEAIGFENTCFYKLVCKDPETKDVFVGYTTNMVQRRYLHKAISSQNINTIKKNKKLYETIQEKGGWDNWDMILIEQCKCDGALDARKKAREHLGKLRASLNKHIPSRTKNEHYEYNAEIVLDRNKKYRDANFKKIYESYNTPLIFR